MPVSTNEAANRKRLGRGLNSLISTPIRVEVHPSNAASQVSSTHPTPTAATTEGQIQSLAISQIQPNPKQPRQHFDEAALNTLAQSIKTSGLMQPIVVRPPSPGSAGKYQLIAGERRWRAAQRAGLLHIPAIVRNVDDRSAAELSLIENIQREDLNPLERAEAFQRLIDEFSLTHQEIADRVSLDRSSITNHLRLLELDEAAKTAVRTGDLSMGHAKVLLGITNIKHRSDIVLQCLAGQWSVRELEQRIRAQRKGDGSSASAPAPESVRLKSPGAANAQDLERRLSEHLGTKVHLQPGRKKGAGRLIIDFFDLDQFEGILKQMQFDAG